MKNSLDAERQVIGGILLDCNKLTQVNSTGININDFSDKNLGQLFNYMSCMHDEAEHIDPLTLNKSHSLV